MINYQLSINEKTVFLGIEQIKGFVENTYPNSIRFLAEKILKVRQKNFFYYSGKQEGDYEAKKK